MKYITPDSQTRSGRNTAQLLFRDTRCSQRRIARFIKEIPPEKQVNSGNENNGIWIGDSDSRANCIMWEHCPMHFTYNEDVNS